MNVPYMVPLNIATDAAAFNLGISTPQNVDLSLSTAVYADIGEHYHGAYVFTPTENAQTAETDGLIMDDDITVNAIPSDYVGSDVPQKDSLSVSGATVTADSGFYENGASATIQDATYVGGFAPSIYSQDIIVDSTGEISASVVIEGMDPFVYQPGYAKTTDKLYYYNSGGTSLQLPTQSATTVTPNDTQQTIVLAGKFTTGDIKVDPIPRTVNDFLGRDAEYIRDIHSHDYVLSSTGYNSWTPSTTASSIVAAQSLTAFAGDLANYEYCVRWLFDAGIKYNTGTTQKAIILREVEEVWQVIAKRPSSLANIGANNFNGNNCSTYFTAALMDYYNTSGTRTFTWSASYGLYLSMTAATFSNSTSDTPNITIKTPAIYARCSNTYFSTARAADVDKANSKMAIKGELYRVKKDSSPSSIMFGHVVNLYNDSIIS